MKEWYNDLFNNLIKNSDKDNAIKMSAYMQNKFSFLGISKPKLNEIIKPYLRIAKKETFSWDFINVCWKKEYREAQYVALEYLKINEKHLVKDDLERLKELIITKSWWETVDTIDYYVGVIIQKNKELIKEILEWSNSDNIWLRRCAIDFQQDFKKLTDTSLLEQIICNNLGSKEFFINKAIGWSLRDYSKINPKWVREFLEKYNNQLDKLSIKEASKYL